MGFEWVLGMLLHDFMVSTVQKTGSKATEVGPEGVMMPREDLGGFPGCL